MQTLYGLPEQVLWCKKCVISNQRPNSAVEFKHTIDSKKETINFDAEGVCSACRAAEDKKRVDWKARRLELERLCDKFRNCNGRGNYDCLVPGSGGKDSFYQSWMLKYEFGMHPLTITWSPNLYTSWGRKNHQTWLESGFDNELVTPNPIVHALLTRIAIEKLFHPFQPFIFGQKNLAPKIALMHHIPLVFYGENEAEYGNPLADMSSAVRAAKYYAQARDDEMFLGGVSVEELVKHYGLEMNDLKIYFPADYVELSRAEVQVHYLGYYLPWHPQENFYFAVEKTNGKWQCAPEQTPGTYSKYNSLDDMIDDYHYWTTFIKFGIGRASYDASQEIRNDDITREQGVSLVKQFDGEWPSRFWPQVSEYLSIEPDRFNHKQAEAWLTQPMMTEEYIKKLADKFRSPHLWQKNDKGEWKLRHAVYAN